MMRISSRLAKILTLLPSRTEKMMRRVKDKRTRQKQQNSTLRSELDALRRGSETSSRTRVVNGWITPLSDGSHENSTRTQLAEATRQLQRATAENTNLHKKVAALQTEVEQLRESLAAARMESDLHIQQIEDLETEMDRLDAASTVESCLCISSCCSYQIVANPSVE
jgi:uncharacterized protein YlxW (UPF0749 family)